MIYSFLGGFVCSLLPAFIVFFVFTLTSAVKGISDD